MLDVPAVYKLCEKAEFNKAIAILIKKKQRAQEILSAAHDKRRDFNFLTTWDELRGNYNSITFAEEELRSIKAQYHELMKNRE